MSSPTRWPSFPFLAAGLPAAAMVAVATWPAVGPAAPVAPTACRGAAAQPTPDPKRISMTPSPRARGASGTMLVRMGPSAYGVAVAPDGSYRLRVEVATEGLQSAAGAHHVAWIATPELDRHRRLGTLGPDGRVSGEATWNKFLVFVTAETTPEPATWSQEILLSALSPSGRMHTMAGHGPFSGEPCLDPRS